MNNWHARRLDSYINAGDITLGRGEVISKDDIESYPGPYPIYSSSAHNNGKFGEYGYYLFDEELVTWSVDGGGNLFYRPKHKYSVTNVCGFMRINNNNLDAKFIYYTLSNQHRYLTFDYTTKAHPSVIKKLYWLPEISFEKQLKIAKILQTIDQSIERTKVLIKKYRQIKTGLMHDLFTRGITADGKLRPTKEQAPQLYKETSIGWIPKDWDLSVLSTKACTGIPHIRTGPFGSALKGEHWVNEGHPVITIGALGEGKFIISELLYIGDDDARRLSDFKLKNGDVVFSRVADVGRSVVIEEDQVDWIMSSNLMRISLDRAQVLPKFLQYQLAADIPVKKQIRCKVNAGGRDVANSDILNSLLFVWPSPDEQANIVRKANSIDTRINNELCVVQKLYQQKMGLMNDLLTGKVPVKIDETEVPDV
ncbi:restriction endonuclease subunit S [Acinetobacter sp. ANC 4216]|uniref:restriction endonuclease subunit S n=1 Tax=Acinetobacter sp. ANC 4216 TaxID=2529840 RepID=UPI00103C2A7D|nr:restriction endonuclease subunit S [Acinetobacter sp. ANC 4216]TCB70267.1 restriction endonuclease subunit S [Acinetobacter sp. ANC 4216]